MSKLRLHLDADTSNKALYQELLNQGYDVTRTPSTWMPPDANDERQLLGATAQGRCIFTFNVRDFMVLARQHTQHAGIILAVQSHWSLSDLIKALDRLMSETQAKEWVGQVRWLNQWR